MLKDKIDLDLLIWNTAGHVKVAPVVDDQGRPWIDRENDRLLNLVYYISYIKEGREMLWSEVPEAGKTEDQARANLTAKIRAKFPTATLTDAEVDLVIDAHFAAHGYAKAFGANDADEMKRRQEQFIAKARFVTDALYEASMGHIISMVW